MKYEKVILNLITACFTLGSKNCHKIFVRTASKSFVLLRRNFGHQFFGELFSFNHIRGFKAWMAWLRPYQSISIRFKVPTLTRLFQYLLRSLFCLSDVDLLVNFGSLSCYLTHVFLNLRWKTDATIAILLFLFSFFYLICSFTSLHLGYDFSLLIIFKHTSGCQIFMRFFDS